MIREGYFLNYLLFFELGGDCDWGWFRTRKDMEFFIAEKSRFEYIGGDFKVLNAIFINSFLKLDEYIDK